MRLAVLRCFAVTLVVSVAGVAHADRPAAMSAQTIKLPSGPTSLKGLGESFSAEVASGSGSFTVPIELPPALLAPSFALSYAAGSGKGVAGMSWSLPLVEIYRTTDKGSPKFAETDRFAVRGPGLNDELVRVDAVSGTYRLKNEGAFALFKRNAGSDSWTIRLPSGATLYVGESAAARESGTLGSYRWLIEREADRFGHEVRYTYFKDQNRVYLRSASYQLHAAAQYQNKVTFVYEARPDPFFDYSYGQKVVTAQRLKTITVQQGTMQQGPRVLRTYGLEYRNSLIFSLLVKVSMTGEGGLAMPAVTFDYLEPNLNAHRFVEMVSRPPLDGLANGAAQFEDMNGDGLPDLLLGTSGNWRYYENLDGVSWRPTPTSLSNSPDRNLYDGDIVLADFDGDGDRDVGHTHASAFRYYPAATVWRGALTGFGAPVTLATSDTGFNLTSREVKLSDLNADGRVDLLWQKPGQDAQLLNQNDRLQSSYIAELPADADFQDGRVELRDFNGDGVLDLVRKEIGWNPTRIRVWFGTGNGAYAAEQQLGNVPVGEASEFFLEDVNRDGQSDLVRVSGSYATYFLNDGNMQLTGPRGDFRGLPSVSDTKKLLFLDMNGNGTTDVVWVTLDGGLRYLDLVGEPYFGLLSRIDNGMGAVTDIAYRSAVSYLADAKRKGQFWSTTLPIPVPVISEVVTRDSLDKLGVPSADQVVSYQYGEGYYDGREREFRGFGVTTTTEWGDDTHATLVSEQRTHLGRNLANLADEEPLKGKPFLKLLKTAQGELLQSIESKWEQRWLCQETSGSATTILPLCNNYPDKTAAKDSLVTLAVSTITLTGSWEKTNTPRYSASVTEYDAWASPIRERVHGEVSFPSGRTPGSAIDLSQATLTVGNDEVVQETDFLYDVGDWLVGLAYQQRSLTTGGTILEQSRTYFDGAAYQGLPLGQADAGLVSRREVWLEGEEEPWIPSVRNQFNADGLTVSTQDANANLVDLAYDAETRSFPILERHYVESGSIDFTAKYDPAYGAVTESTDPNGHKTLYTYDGLGRADKVVDPLGTLAVPLVDYDYEYGTTANPVSKTTVRTLTDRAGAVYRTSYQFSDGLGRTRLTKTQAEGSYGYVASGYAHFTARGGANRVYDNFTSQSAVFEAPPAGTPVVTRTLDALSRVTDATFPATTDLPSGFVRTSYLPFESWEYDERDTDGGLEYGTHTFFDGLGRALAVEKKNDQGGTVKTLRWETDYDALGRIVAFRDPAWTENADSPTRDARSKRSYAYDSLSRLIELTDPNLGHIVYRYDDVGNLRTRIDALNQEEGWEYGLANRLVRRTFKRDAKGKPDYAHHYYYDAAAPSTPLSGARNLLGRLSWVEYPTGREHYSYDEQGREIDQAVEQWDGTSSFSSQLRPQYFRKESYDAEGKTASITLPGNFSVAAHYNARGLLSGFSGGPDGAARTILSNLTYDARGLTTRTDHGNGTRSCATYDRRGQLTAVLTGKSSGANEVTCGELGAPGSSVGVSGLGFQHLRYVRTHNANIASIQDLSAQVKDAGGKNTVPRLDATYRYDRLNQLIYASDAQGTFQFGYDSTQNLISRTFTATAASGLGSSTSLPTGNFTYGERGAGPNMVTGAGGKTYDYDALGRMKAYNGYTLDYDVEGNLVSATKGNTTLKFHYDPWGERRLTLVQRGLSATPEVTRHLFDEYEIRNGDETWLIGGGNTQVEVSKSQGVVIDDNLYLLDQLLAYVNGSARDPKPLPAEYMDFTGDGAFDMADYNAAATAYGSPRRERLGGQKLVWRYYHRDQITGTTHATDAAGDLVTHVLYDVYGKTSQPKGMAPVRGFAGAELEADKDLGLVRFGARFYAPDLARWVTGDRYVGESPERSATLPLESNLYSYSHNNPVRYVDRSGEIPVDTIWDAANVIYDIGKIGVGLATDNPVLVAEGAKDLAMDAVAMAVPYVPAGATKVLKYGDDVVEAGVKAAKALDGAKDTAKAAKAAKKAEAAGEASASANKVSKQADGITYELKKPKGVSEEAWQKKMEALNAGAKRGEAKVVHKPQRSGAAQRQAHAEGRIKKGEHADHGLDLQFGGKDDAGNIISTNARVNTSVGAQGRARMKHPDGTPIKEFVSR